MPGDLLSRPLIEIAADLREKRVTAWELTEAAIGRHERFGERLHAYSLWAPVQSRAVAQAADAAFAPEYRSVPSRAFPFRSRTCSPPLGIPASPGRAAGYRLIAGNGTDRWWPRCAASSGSSWARPIWSSSRSVGPAITATGAPPITRGTHRRIARPAARRAVPALACWKAPRCSPSAAILPARSGSRPR